MEVSSRQECWWQLGKTAQHRPQIRGFDPTQLSKVSTPKASEDVCWEDPEL